MIGRLWRKRLYRREAVRALFRDVVGRRTAVLESRRHLQEAAAWLARAQRATPDGGVAAAYSFEDGWVASYPETTGYIIPTILTFGERVGDPSCAERAGEMAEWLLGMQYPEGGFPGHFADRRHPPVVFNTGQIIFGLLAAHQASGDGRLADAACRAADWLGTVQDEDGAWRRFDYHGRVHSYNTRTAWALVELGLWSGDRAYVRTGERNLDWAVRQQRANGWFGECAFRPGQDPFVHTIAYASQGLLEAGLRLGRDDYVSVATRTCEAVLSRTHESGWIAGTFDHDWRPTARYSCLTGNAQMAVQWLKLHAVTGREEFRQGAARVIRFLKGLQECTGTSPGIRGAVKGSHPIWGRYLFGTYPNWGAKFFMDALLVDDAAGAGHALACRTW